MYFVLVFVNKLISIGMHGKNIFYSACVHDVHALDSKGRCWSVKQISRVDSEEAEPLFSV